MEGHQLAIQLQITHHLLERHELVSRTVDVLLIHFISQNHNVLTSADLADILNVLTREALSSGVTRIHSSNSLHSQTLSASTLYTILNSTHIQSPILLLVQIVRLILTSEHMNRSRVQRVLRNRNQNTVSWLVNQQLQRILNSLRSTIRQEDILGITRISVTLLNVLGYILTHLGNTSSVRVSTRTTRVSNQQLLSSLQSIRMEHLRMLLSNLRPRGDTQNLTQESNRLLLNSLRITDVAVQQRVKRELLALLHLSIDLNSANNNLSTDCIISSTNLLVDVVDRDARREASQSGNSNILSQTQHCCYG